MHRSLLLSLTLALAGWTPDAAAAQDPGALTGRVLAAEAGLPLAGVSVTLEGSERRDTTDGDGHFSFSRVPPGVTLVRLQREGYVSLVERVEVAGGEASLLQFQLHPIGAILEELFVVAGGGRGREAAARGHSEAEIAGGGEGARSAADLLARSVPGLTLVRAGGSAGAAVRVRLRGVNSITLSDQPSVYLDGVRIDDGGATGGGGLGGALHVLDQIPAAQVSRIRVLRGPAAASAYPNGAAGVIVIETVRARSPEDGSA